MIAPVTYLFVPGDRPDRFDKALAAGADRVVLDLEDAVATDAKAAARTAIRSWLGTHRHALPQLVVRVNAVGSDAFAQDLALLREAGVDCAMLAKAESVDAIRALGAALAHPGRVLALVETARGVDNVDALAADAAVARLVFGSLDYAADLGLSGDMRGFAYPAARIASASRLAGLAPPVWGVTPEIDDAPQIAADVALARAYGFAAKLCIHPRQVEAVRAAFAPTPDELAWAHRVIAAAAQSAAAITLDGCMVDAPLVLRARSIIARG